MLTLLQYLFVMEILQLGAISKLTQDSPQDYLPDCFCGLC